jgi:hypothetical protein
MSPRRRKERSCDWCFRRIGDMADEFNGGIGHPECARYAYEAVAGPDAIPWPPARRFYRQDPIVLFLERLASEAVRAGIDPQRLATAVARTRHVV